MTQVRCGHCGKVSEFMDEVLFGFDCGHCEKHNDEGEYEFV